METLFDQLLYHSGPLDTLPTRTRLISAVKGTASITSMTCMMMRMPCIGGDARVGGPLRCACSLLTLHWGTQFQDRTDCRWDLHTFCSKHCMLLTCCIDFT
jgi:hypothetical protein